MKTPSQISAPRPRPRFASRWRAALRTVVAAAVITTLAGGGCRALASRLTLNLTASMPRGLYWLRPGSPVSRDTTVSLSIPPSIQSLVATRGYLPADFPLLKRIVAISGDHVCTAGDRYVVGNTVISTIARHDHVGRPLEPYQFCGAVPTGYVFLAANGESSLDSRYFGPVAIGALTAAVPIWTFF
ncbi:MAG TPA: S26 family signal peptidase [Polyangia bacterium]|nr:S26 family signal peptidase [Polyangia bacterium]